MLAKHAIYETDMFVLFDDLWSLIAKCVQNKHGQVNTYMFVGEFVCITEI